MRAGRGGRRRGDGDRRSWRGAPSGGVSWRLASLVGAVPVRARKISSRVVGAGRGRRRRCRRRRARARRRRGRGCRRRPGPRPGRCRRRCWRRRRRRRRGRRRPASAWSRSRGWASTTSWPPLGLELGRGALGDRAAVVDDHDPVGQVVGLVEVLRREHDVGAVGDELADGLPEPDAAGRVESGRRLVEQQHAVARRRAWRRGRGDGACRPTSRAPGGRRPRQVEPLEHGGGAPLASRREKPNRRATISRFSMPVIASSTAADWPASPIRPRTRSGGAGRRRRRRAASRRRAW